MLNYLKQKNVKITLIKEKSYKLELNPYASTYDFKGNKDAKTSAAVLCGILLFAESHKMRNPTNLKLEKAEIKKVIFLAEKGCKNPFAKVLSNKTAQYTPALDGESFGTDFEIAGGGGKKQTQMLLGAKVIDGEIAVLVDALPTSFKLSLNGIKSQFKTFTNTLSKIDAIDFIVNTSTLNGIGKFCGSGSVPKNKNEASMLLTSAENLKEAEFREKVSTLFNDKAKNIVGFIPFSESILSQLTPTNTIRKELQKHRFAAMVEQHKTNEGYIKIKALPNNKVIDVYDFGGSVMKTPKQFFSHQIKTNLKRIYKLRNRTVPTQLLKGLD